MNRHHAILNPFSFALALLAVLTLSLPADERGRRILKRVVPALRKAHVNQMGCAK